MKQTLTFAGAGSQSIQIDFVPQYLFFGGSADFSCEVKTDSGIIVQSQTPVFSDAFPFLLPLGARLYGGPNLAGFTLGTGLDNTKKCTVTITANGAGNVDVYWCSNGKGTQLLSYERNILAPGSQITLKDFYYAMFDPNVTPSAYAGNILVDHIQKSGYSEQTSTLEELAVKSAFGGALLSRSQGVSKNWLLDNTDGNYSEAILKNTGALSIVYFVVRIK